MRPTPPQYRASPASLILDSARVRCWKHRVEKEESALAANLEKQIATLESAGQQAALTEAALGGSAAAQPVTDDDARSVRSHVSARSQSAASHVSARRSDISRHSEISSRVSGSTAMGAKLALLQAGHRRRCHVRRRAITLMLCAWRVRRSWRRNSRAGETWRSS